MKRIFLFFLLLAPAFPAVAVDLSAEGIYRTTFEACSKVTEQDLHNQNADRLRAGYFPTREYTELLEMVGRNSAKGLLLEMKYGPSKISEYLGQQQDFLRALNDCYPQNPRMVQFFQDSLKRADRAGKVIGVAGVVAVTRGVGQLVRLSPILLGSARKVYWSLVLATRLSSDSSSSIVTPEQKDRELKNLQENLP